MKKKSDYSRKGLLTEIFRKEAESQNNRNHKCYNNAAMNMTPEITKLFEEAKFAIEEMRAQYGFGTEDPNDIQPPTWLSELEAAVEAVENAQ